MPKKILKFLLLVQAPVKLILIFLMKSYGVERKDLEKDTVSCIK